MLKLNIKRSVPKCAPTAVFVLVFLAACWFFRAALVFLDETQKPETNLRSAEPQQPIVWIRMCYEKPKVSCYHYNDMTVHRSVFKSLGYKFGSKESSWDVLWYQTLPDPDKIPFPYDILPYLNHSKAQQRINHVPGTEFYTSKVILATSGLPGIPPAFVLPESADHFWQFANQHPEKKWVQKSYGHRGVRIRSLEEIAVDFQGSKNFLQEFVDNPLLIDGRKFDIGVYVVVTSVLPLRVYMWDEDIRIKFSKADYYPFDAKIRDKYAIASDSVMYLEMPTLKRLDAMYNGTGKECFNAYLESQQIDPSVIWKQIRHIGTTVIRGRMENFVQPKLLNSTLSKKLWRNFFELARMDFIVDENLKVYLMEINRTPGLPNKYVVKTKYICQRILMDALSLVGIASKGADNSEFAKAESTISEWDIQVFDDFCYGQSCEDCSEIKCRLCSRCIHNDQYMLDTIRDAYLEHKNRRGMRRLIPEPLTSQESTPDPNLEEDRLMRLWFESKCAQDSSWCE